MVFWMREFTLMKQKCLEKAMFREATLFWTSDFVRKEVQRAVFNCRDFLRYSFSRHPSFNLMMKGRPHLTDHVQSDHYLQQRERQQQDEQILVFASRLKNKWRQLKQMAPAHYSYRIKDWWKYDTDSDHFFLSDYYHMTINWMHH